MRSGRTLVVANLPLGTGSAVTFRRGGPMLTLAASLAVRVAS